jgi:CheY-like chemotaxis protein
VPTKILVADDSATMRRVLEMTFAGEDARVVSVDSGEAAVNKAAELVPDVVFADASLPGVDGYEVARRIKANPNLGKVAVIVMASQHGPYDDGKGRAAGVDDHISKPFDTQSVIDRVSQVLSRPRQAAAGAVAAGGAARPAAAAAAPAAPAAPAPARGPMQATRMGLGTPVAVQPAPAPAPKQAPQPAPQQVRPAATAPMMPVAAAPAAAPKPAPERVSAVPRSPAAAVTAASGELASRLNGLGLTKEQLEGVLLLSREVIEQVVWEVVPDLAEQLIREEIKRLTAE